MPRESASHSARQTLLAKRQTASPPRSALIQRTQHGKNSVGAASDRVVVRPPLGQLGELKLKISCARGIGKVREQVDQVHLEGRQLLVGSVGIESGQWCVAHLAPDANGTVQPLAQVLLCAVPIIVAYGLMNASG